MAHDVHAYSLEIQLGLGRVSGILMIWGHIVF